MVEAICDIGSSTLEEGLIPEELKSIWVTPIWKGKDKEDPSDYRPIAITNHIMKVIERVARRQIVDHLTLLGYLDNEQHGARSFRSTLSQLLEQNDWMVDALCSGSNLELLYLDFAKAFDLVDISILLTKLKNFKVTGKLLNWI